MDALPLAASHTHTHARKASARRKNATSVQTWRRRCAAFRTGIAGIRAGRWTCVQLVHSRSPNGSGSRSRAALRPPRARILRFVLLRSVRNFESAHVNFTPSQIHKHTECILRYENKAHYVQIELFLHTCTCRASLNSSL